MDDPQITRHQARIFGQSLIGQVPNESAIDLYVKAMHTPVAVSPADMRLLTFVQRYPMLVGFIDGGLALVNPQSEVRRRLYTMFAILEATPAYAELFLPQNQSKLYVIRIIFVGLRASIRGVFGVILVKMVARS